MIPVWKKVESPVIELGSADILVSFEKMEALRWLEYLKPGGKVVVNDLQINSTPILTGRVDYPEGIFEELESKIATMVVPASKHAEELGNSKVMNIILLGTIVKAMGLEEIDWESIIRNNIPEKLANINIKAITLGMSIV